MSYPLSTMMEPELARALTPELDPCRGVLLAKYAVLLAYMAYGDQLAFPARDGLYQHFSAHADEERKWIYELHRHSSARRAPQFLDASVDVVDLTTPEPALTRLLQLEARVLDAWTAWDQLLRRQQPQPLGLSGFVQDGARATLAHMEDLRRYLGGLT